MARLNVHTPAQPAGLCISCHKTENAEGKAAPVKCADCHTKDFEPSRQRVYEMAF